MLGSWSSCSKSLWIKSFKWGTIENCRLKDCKVISLQSLPRLGMDPRPHSSLAILAESDQAILIIFDCQLWEHITLLKIVIESLIVPHFKYLIHICLEPENQDPSRTLKIIYAFSNFIERQISALGYVIFFQSLVIIGDMIEKLIELCHKLYLIPYHLFSFQIQLQNALILFLLT